MNSAGAAGQVFGAPPGESFRTAQHYLISLGFKEATYEICHFGSDTTRLANLEKEAETCVPICAFYLSAVHTAC
eukprot:scaffold309504_cov36-Prasinocladus_malaysianus.AAC.1